MSRPILESAVPLVKKSTLTIVGIGASAGGLEALKIFLSHLPSSSGAAFVIVQHLSADYKGVMPELLQRVTQMKVMQAENHMKVKSDCIYVIPPNKNLSILNGSLLLLKPQNLPGLRLPIDFFFRALAVDQHELAVGIILSGMGSDGTMGMQAIKENSGMTMVQSPESAKFDSMPSHAIAAGVADYVLCAQDLPERLLTYINHSFSGVNVVHKPPGLQSSYELENITNLLRERTGNEFSLYKKNTINRRIERRMGLHQITNISFYVRYLRENPQELDLLFKELLIGVTNFFRDPLVWEQLLSEDLPELLAQYPSGRKIRAWVSACSTGEEAYSLAMTFKESLEEANLQELFTLQIFATDLDEGAIEAARLGIYPANIEADISPQRLARFFIKDGDGYRVNKEIREMIIFATQNIIMDPPFTNLDILTCRNLLIYFGTELQDRLLPLFHYSLCTQGLLILGTSETVGSFSSLYNAANFKSKIYKRIDTPSLLREYEFPTKLFSNSYITETQTDPPQYMKKTIPNIQMLADQVLLQNFSPAAVLTNSDGDILYINGRTGKYLEPAAGKANWNLYAMVREGLKYELEMAIKKAKSQKERVNVPNLLIDNNKYKQTISLSVELITTPEELHGSLMITFTDMPTPQTSQNKQTTSKVNHNKMQADVQLRHEQIQSLREEMQSSQEELKSSNEELQSTNEELTTSKEEMQSLNEELQTVNAELQSKVEALSWVNNDMENLLNSTEIATVFLDGALHVRRFTDYATHLFKLIPSDVGRPLFDVVSELDYSSLQIDATEVLRTLMFIEKQVPTKDGRWFKVRIMPYRTHDNMINGVVITFADISEHQQVDVLLLETLAVLQSRYIDQTTELNTAKPSEMLLNKAQLVLEQHFKQHNAGLVTSKSQKIILSKAQLVLEQCLTAPGMDKAMLDFNPKQTNKKL